MNYLRRSAVLRFAVAIAAVAIAFAVEISVWVVFNQSPFMLFYAAVMVAVWFGGPGPGLLAMALGTLGAQWLITPGNAMWISTWPEAVRLAGFMLVSGVIVALANRMHGTTHELEGTQRRLGDERVALERALGELQAEQASLAQAHGQLQVQAEEMEVTAEELKAQSDELQQTERQLRRQLGFTSAITAGMHEGLYAIDTQGHCTFANPAAEQVLGWTRGELLGRSMHETIHYQRANGTAYPVSECPSTRVLATGVPIRVQNEVFTRRDGTLLPVWYSAAPLIADGRVTGVVVAFTDDTERRRGELERDRLLEAERAARDSAEQARARTVQILETIEEGFFDIDRAMRFRHVNRRGGELLKLDPQSMIGRSVLELFPDAGVLPAFAALERVIASGQPASAEDYYPPLDLWFEVQFYPAPDGVAVFMRDIGERKRGELALRENEERLRIAVEAGQLGTWDWDPRSGRLMWSSRLQQIFGFSPDGFGGTFEQFMNGVHPDDRERLLAEIARATERGGDYLVRHRVCWPDGTVRWVEGRGRVVKGPDGEPERVLGVALDVTERELAGQHLERTVRERTAALDETVAELESFSYSVAHDLRAPIRAMRGFADAILDDATMELNRNPQEYARRIAESAEHMDTLIQDLLAYSRLARSDIELQPVNLRHVLDEVFTHMPGVLDGANVRVEVPPEAGYVVAHRATLFQVLTNLVTNAIKFVTPGVAPQVTVRAEALGRRVRIWVEDRGIGIAPKYHERIFRVFERLHRTEHYPGTGVGLAIVRRAMQRMGGTYGVESEVGQGSRFWIELPRADA